MFKRNDYEIVFEILCAWDLRVLFSDAHYLIYTARNFIKRATMDRVVEHIRTVSVHPLADSSLARFQNALKIFSCVIPLSIHPFCSCVRIIVHSTQCHYLGER